VHLFTFKDFGFKTPTLHPPKTSRLILYK